MRTFPLVAGTLLVISASALSLPAAAEPEVTTVNFAVMRNGEQIGTSSVRLHHQGPQTVAEVAAHIQVKLFGIPVYRFEQSETENWADGRLQSLTSQTDDNGTVHRVSARRRGAMLIIDADGKTSEVDGSVIPASLWNAQLVQKTMALNLQTGTLTPVSVVDHGTERLVLQGRPLTAHHYSINTSMAQDVWYDERQQLVRVEMRGSDGSRIRYQPG